MSLSAVPVNVMSIYNNALDLSVKGDYKTALNEYRRAIEVCPTFIEAYNNIGEIYSRLGEKNLARSTYEKALGIDRNYRLLLNMGVEFYNEREYYSALNYFTESLSKKSNFLEGNYYTGMTFFNLHDVFKAEKYFDNVVRIDQKHLKANYLLSYIHYNWKDYAKTLNYLNNIRDIADDSTFINKYYGFCHYYLGRYDEAVRYLTIAVETNPKYQIFKDYLKKLTYENKLNEIGDVNLRIKVMEEKMVKEKPSLRDYTHLSMLYMFNGEYKKAEDILTDQKKKLA